MPVDKQVVTVAATQHQPEPPRADEAARLQLHRHNTAVGQNEAELTLGVPSQLAGRSGSETQELTARREQYREQQPCQEQAAQNASALRKGGERQTDAEQRKCGTHRRRRLQRETAGRGGAPASARGVMPRAGRAGRR